MGSIHRFFEMYPRFVLSIMETRSGVTLGAPLRPGRCAAGPLNIIHVIGTWEARDFKGLADRIFPRLRDKGYPSPPTF